MRVYLYYPKPQRISPFFYIFAPITNYITMNKIEDIRKKYPGYYMNNVPSHYRWSKENVNKYSKDKELVSSYRKEDIIAYSKSIESLEGNIDKILGLLL